MTTRAAYWPHMLFITCSIVLSAGAQLLMKAGMQELNGVGMTRFLHYSPEVTAVLVPSAIWVLSGLTFYALSMLFWMAALAKYKLSQAYPLLSLSYVMVYLGAIAWPRLHDTVSPKRMFGILFIIAGVLLVTRPNNEARNAQDAA
jgi:undecaprenyl phosphate-alpha-L-ara4N flippase subunit ArnF